MSRIDNSVAKSEELIIKWDADDDGNEVAIIVAISILEHLKNTKTANEITFNFMIEYISIW